jgi:hypothetical protein
VNQVAPGRFSTAQNGLIGADLSRANFRNTDLSRAFLEARCSSKQAFARKGWQPDLICSILAFRNGGLIKSS